MAKSKKSGNSLQSTKKREIIAPRLSYNTETKRYRLVIAVENVKDGKIEKEEKTTGKGTGAQAIKNAA